MTQRATAPTPSTLESVLRLLVRAMDAHAGLRDYAKWRPDLAHALEAAHHVLAGRELVQLACMHDGCAWAGMFEPAQVFRCANCGDSRGVPVSIDDAARRTRSSTREKIELGTHGVCMVCLAAVPHAELDAHYELCLAWLQQQREAQARHNVRLLGLDPEKPQ